MCDADLNPVAYKKQKNGFQVQFATESDCKGIVELVHDVYERDLSKVYGYDEKKIAEIKASWFPVQKYTDTIANGHAKYLIVKDGNTVVAMCGVFKFCSFDSKEEMDELLLMIDEERVTRTILANKLHTEPSWETSYLSQLFVKQEYQGQGISALFYAFCKQELKEVKKLIFYCAVSNSSVKKTLKHFQTQLSVLAAESLTKKGNFLGVLTI